MPLIHRRLFRIRSYECDAHGHLNNANYLQLMQETAFDASAAAGYDMQRYTNMQRHWLIRETNIEFLKPIHTNDPIEVSTWIRDFRRVSSRRAYEFRLAEDGQLAARGVTDWVFLNTLTRHPTSIPAYLTNDFFPEGIPASFPPRTPFPQLPPPATGAFCMPRRVEWNDIDSMQHVNNAVYLNYVTECSMQALAAYGWPWERLHALGLAVHLRRCQIQYLQPALHGDQLEIKTWISNLRRVTANRHYTIRRLDGTLLAQAQTYSVWVDRINGGPARIPAELARDIEGLVAR